MRATAPQYDDRDPVVAHDVDRGTSRDEQAAQALQSLAVRAHALVRTMENAAAAASAIASCPLK